MAKISPLAAKTLHNIIASYAEALEKKAPEVNPASVPLPKQTEDEVDDLTFVYADFNETEEGWGDRGSSDITSDNSSVPTPRTSTEQVWGTDGSTNDGASKSLYWGDDATDSSPRESIVNLWFQSNTVGTPLGSDWSASNVSSLDRDGSDWGWVSRMERKAKMETYKRHRVQQWTPRELELLRYHDVFDGRDDDRDHDRLLAARYMKERALDFVKRRRSQAKSRFHEHSDRLAMTSEKESLTNTEPGRERKNRWTSMTVEEV